MHGDLEKEGMTGEIVAERIVLCSTTGAVETIACWFASYAAFNYVYPKRWKNTLIFIQKCLLDVKDSLKTPQIVLYLNMKLHEKLSKLIN